MQENRAQAARTRKRGARYLLQGLVVCKQCGYAYYGKPLSQASAKGHGRHYAYYPIASAAMPVALAGSASAPPPWSEPIAWSRRRYGVNFRLRHNHGYTGSYSSVYRFLAAARCRAAA